MPHKERGAVALRGTKGGPNSIQIAQVVVEGIDPNRRPPGSTVSAKVEGGDRAAGASEPPRKISVSRAVIFETMYDQYVRSRGSEGQPSLDEELHTVRRVDGRFRVLWGRKICAHAFT